MRKILILWDIDGTLLHSSGAGMRALHEAFTRVFGVKGTFEGIDFAGRTDRMIIRQVFARFGIEYTQAHIERLAAGYVATLPEVLGRSDSVVLPGVAGILREAAARADVAQGLLTGNLRAGARVKLGHHGLWDYFPVGAFADDSEIRNELGPYAMQRARQHWGADFALEDTWVVGDTPHDVACARAFGARSLAVATGSTSLEDLRTCTPDAALADLSDTEAFWALLGG